MGIQGLLPLLKSMMKPMHIKDLEGCCVAIDTYSWLHKEFYQKAVDISPSIAHELIQVLKQENISYVVAPYEADAQMTFLAISKQVEAVITEDSDLIAFGCPRIWASC
ncbi:hypothetical protein LWI28_006918 [Acer negundo]|uniref:Exonuclease 1 n=1 Tax=Acer negundo TaxID=4023 RepID=A0AAD5P3X7_ACENE|nr:hypothetical protein LWI28_006918 [Acer negundo]